MIGNLGAFIIGLHDYRGREEREGERGRERERERERERDET